MISEAHTAAAVRNAATARAAIAARGTNLSPEGIAAVAAILGSGVRICRTCGRELSLDQFYRRPEYDQLAAAWRRRDEEAAAAREADSQQPPQPRIKPPPPDCSTPGCAHPALADGKCGPCYRRWYDGTFRARLPEGLQGERRPLRPVAIGERERVSTWLRRRAGPARRGQYC